MATEAMSTELAVIGGGPGGYAAAFMAADLGMDVTLIDVEENPGGTCLYRGCIPSKALLHVAKLLNDAREADEWGLKYSEPEIDINVIRDKTNGVVQQLTKGLGQLGKARKVKYIRGRASFLDSNTLSVVESDINHDELRFEKAIIAAGSRPTLFGPLIDSSRIMNSTDALKLEDVPKNLLVIGGGYIGLELGSVYSALGAQVTVVEMMPNLLPGADADLVAPLQKRLEKQFADILLSTKVAKMEEQKNGIKVTFEGENIKKPTRIFDKVLVCVGRKPNSSGLSLKNTDVEVDKHGFIQVNAARQTNEPHIFAIGDIVGGPMLAHKASAEGKSAAEAASGKNVAFEPQAIPAVIFTDPEIAWCGLTETEAKEQERKVTVGRFPWAASGRALTIGRSEGLTKVITDTETGHVLGVGIVGPGAGELIAEGVLAVEMGATAEDLDLTIHPHPTLTETIMEAAGSIFGSSTHLYRPKKKSATT